MTDPYHSKPGPRPGSGGPAKPSAEAAKPAAPGDKADPQGSAGRVVHDARGNAVWQWVKDAGRVCIESTSMLLKRLEVPELKVEEHKEDNELRLAEDDVDQGGGFDPYGTRVGTRKASPPPKAPPPKKK
jgi:hypothetical protein